MDTTKKIRIVFIKNQPLIWNVDDYVELKYKYHVFLTDDCLIGVPPGGVGQTNDSSLPALLMNEEAHMLISKGYAYACEFPQLTKGPDDDQMKKLKMLENSIISEQLEEMNISRERNKSKSPKKSPSKETNMSHIPIENINNILDSTDKCKERLLLQQIYLEHPLINDQEEKLFSWKYPETEEEKLFCNVYLDLYDRGWHIASGINYGAHFVLYRDLPTLCHGIYLILCKLETEPMHSLDIIIHARVADSTNKKLYFASQDESGKIYYSGMTWTGIST